MSAVAVIDVGAFRQNLLRLGDMIAPTPVMAMLKADAYGHGMLALSRPALDAGASELGILEIAAGLALRADGIEAPLFAWLHGSDADFGGAADARIDVGISTLHELDAASAAVGDVPLLGHLKLDTGLHRNGATVENWPALIARAVTLQAEGRIVVRGIWSHLADASAADDAVSLDVFRQGVDTAYALGARPTLLHLGASSAGIYLPEARFGIVRFGIAAYGLSPFDDRTPVDLGITPVMTLSTTVTAVDGDTATIGAGWGDGLHAPATGRAEVLVRGRRRRMVGMDVDDATIADAADLAIGDAVALFGSGAHGEPTAADWADWAGTIGDEVVTRIARRVPREYVTPGR